MWKKDGIAKGLKNKSPGHSLPGDFQPKPYHNVSARCAYRYINDILYPRLCSLTEIDVKMIIGLN